VINSIVYSLKEKVTQRVKSASVSDAFFGLGKRLPLQSAPVTSSPRSSESKHPLVTTKKHKAPAIGGNPDSGGSTPGSASQPRKAAVIGDNTAVSVSSSGSDSDTNDTKFFWRHRGQVSRCAGPHQQVQRQYSEQRTSCEVLLVAALSHWEGHLVEMSLVRARVHVSNYRSLYKVSQRTVASSATPA